MVEWGREDFLVPACLVDISKYCCVDNVVENDFSLIVVILLIICDFFLKICNNSSIINLIKMTLTSVLIYCVIRSIGLEDYD